MSDILRCPFCGGNKRETAQECGSICRLWHGVGLPMEPAKLKAGDSVWVWRSGLQDSSFIKTVHRITPFQVIVDWDSDGKHLKRFKKSTGWGIGGGFTLIWGLATAEECAAWNSAQKLKKLKQTAKENTEAEIERIRVELVNWMPVSMAVSVSKSQFGTPEEREGHWDIEIHFLTEERVRKLATLLQELAVLL